MDRVAPARRGTALVEDGAGPDGSKALVLSGNSLDDRIAVSQRITYPTPERSRYVTLSFDERADNVRMSSGWYAGVRVQFVGTTVPLVRAGVTSGTHGWKRVVEHIKVPAGTTALAIEPMLDSGSGRLLIDNITTEFADALALVSPKPQATGEVELSWVFEGLAQAPRLFDIHRSTQPDFEPDESTFVRQVPDTEVAEDATTAPGTTYYYKVVARAADGTALATTRAGEARTPATSVDEQATDVLTAATGAEGTRLAWRLAADTTPALEVYAGPATLLGGDLTGARVVGTVDALRGALTVPAGDAAYALVDRSGAVVASARAADLQHPRLWITEDRLAKVRRLIAEPGDPQEMWRQLLARVAQGPVATPESPNPYTPGWGEGEGRYAAEAAFAYQVTGEPAYAQKAYEGIVAAEPKLALGKAQPLENANAAPVLAQAYDWAYPAWTDEQRRDANRILSRMATAFEVAHHPNIDLPTKTSNWVGVVRGGELALRLATRGDGWFDNGESRIPTLVDELRRHLDEAYSDTGWSQEGLEYTNYTLQVMLPGVYAAQDAGVTALDASFARPQFANLYIHSLASTPAHHRLQWGVGIASGRLPTAAMLARSVPAAERAGWQWHFQHTVGSQSTAKPYAGTLSLWPLLGWHESVKPRDPDNGPDSLRRALMDDHGGAYLFRNRFQDAGDVLAALTNRNHSDLGWEGLETFGLSLTSNGVTWARQPAKSYFNSALYSKPLIDGRPEEKSLDPANAFPKSPGQGETLASRAFDDQGGGYVSLDGSRNYGVQTARRDAVVDMRPGDGVSTVIAIHDRFADSASHRYDWQLSPEAGTEITHATGEDGVSTFVFRKNGAWLKGWVLDAAGATVSVVDGALRVTRTGTEADFRVVLATGTGDEPVATVLDGSRIELAGTTYDLLHLDQLS